MAATNLLARPMHAVVERRWGVVQPVGHHTVNVDGEGSNPSAPANFFAELSENFAAKHPEKICEIFFCIYCRCIGIRFVGNYRVSRSGFALPG